MPTRKITVNGIEHEWDRDSINYTDVVHLAYSPEETRLMSVTYTWSDPRPSSDVTRQGTMTPGSTIAPEDGMNFSAYHTGNA